MEENLKELINSYDFNKVLKKNRSNGMFLSEEEVEILEKYNINYLNFSSVSELILEIENILNEQSDLEDLEWLSANLSEYNYYNNTNK